MKKLLIFLLSVASLISFTQCNNPGPEKLCSNAGTRGEIISALMNDDAYMNEVMDSMRIKHPEVIVSTFFVLAKNDKAMQMEMMNNVMSMCTADSSMFKMMMRKTMDMCDADQSKCKMLMSSMQSHSNVMKSVQGMCDMKGMKMDQKK